MIKLKIEIDGYSIADRLLEGVMFKFDVSFDYDKAVKQNEITEGCFIIEKVNTSKSDADYLEGLGATGSAEYWKNKAKESFDWENEGIDQLFCHLENKNLKKEADILDNIWNSQCGIKPKQAIPIRKITNIFGQ